MYLHVLGWNPYFQHHWASGSREGLVPARIIEEQREAYRIVAEAGEMTAEVVGHLRHRFVVVNVALGDVVLLTPALGLLRRAGHDAGQAAMLGLL